MGAVFDELLTFFRPTHVHVREERERLELLRDTAGDAGPRLRVGDTEVTLTVPEDYDGPRAPRGRAPRARAPRAPGAPERPAPSSHRRPPVA